MVNQYLRKMNPPPEANHGAAWTWRTQWVNTSGTNIGEPFDFTAHPELTFTTTLKNSAGRVLATLSSAAGYDGTITGDADGWLTWLLPQIVVDTLPVTKTFIGGVDPRVRMFRPRTLIVFDLSVSDGVHDPWVFFTEHLTVCQAIT